MNQELLKRIEELESQIREIKSFVEEKKKQQITYPLDDASRNIINNTV